MAWKNKQKRDEYYKKNKKKIALRKKEYNKKYHLTYEARRRNNISTWQQIGIKLRPDEDWFSIYEYYISLEECPNCGIEFGGTIKRNLDHDHNTGYIREGVICHRCNVLRR